jgi:DNA-binding MarR family transcriptional regulator
VPDPRDRRAISLVLTEAGEAAVPRIQTALDEISAAVMSPIAGGDQLTLNDLLTRLIERDTAD